MNEMKIIVPRNEVVLIDIDGNPLFVDPLTGSEKIVEIGRFNDHVKPLWDEATGDFIESATAEEIEIARPTPPPIQLSEVQVLILQVADQNQTISDLLDLLFTHVPELTNL